MKRILVLYDGTVYTYRWLSALTKAKSFLLKEGYKISFPEPLHSIKRQLSFEKMLKLIKRDDIVLLAFHPGGRYFDDKKKLLAFISSVNENCEKIIWLDTSDSSGTTFFEVLPYVSKYLKKQIYTDTSLYNKPLCRDRLFCEYYCKKSDVTIVEADKPQNVPITVDDLRKLGISWNVGLGSLFERSKVRFVFDINRKHENIIFETPNFNRKYDIFYRGSLYDSITGYQRKLAIETIGGLTCIHPDPTIRVSQEEYDEEIRNSKTILSPFGCGEICTRDFETFRNGAVLIKPNMSHLKTYPDIFIENQTYISINWDFTDLSEHLNSILENEKEYYRIAKYAQDMYYESLSQAGITEFVDHFLTEIGEKY